MHSSNQPLTPEQIRERFFNEQENYIDRYGNVLNEIAHGAMGEEHFNPLIIHYYLLNGKSEQWVIDNLKNCGGMSDIIAKLTLKQYLSFIKDVLQIDLESHQKEHFSTVGQCNRLSNQLMDDLRTKEEKLLGLPIELDGVEFDADTESVNRLRNYIAVDAVPETWTTYNSSKVLFTKQRAEELLQAILLREQRTHEYITELKSRVRVARENVDYDGLLNLQKEI